MDSRRQLKIGSLIKEVFSQVLLREGKNLYGKALVTVTNVKVTSDLTLARFYLSIYNTDTPDSVIDIFNEKKFEVKRMLAEKLRHDLRRIPEIEFFRDDTLDYVYHMEDVFKKIKEEDERIAKGEPIAKPIKTKKAPAKRAAKKTK
ncbi:MAG: 30S ribosome-binding factor RbfA [Chitinophagales bacterium]|jgi:ribosome-binding factor A|nr:30S ribosome-binding factor RbfA [Chitinophagales bacterium]